MLILDHDVLGEREPVQGEVPEHVAAAVMNVKHGSVVLVAGALVVVVFALGAGAAEVAADPGDPQI